LRMGNKIRPTAIIVRALRATFSKDFEKERMLKECMYVYFVTWSISL